MEMKGKAERGRGRYGTVGRSEEGEYKRKEGVAAENETRDSVRERERAKNSARSKFEMSVTRPHLRSMTALTRADKLPRTPLLLLLFLNALSGLFFTPLLHPHIPSCFPPLSSLFLYLVTALFPSCFGYPFPHLPPSPTSIVHALPPVGLGLRPPTADRAPSRIQKGKVYLLLFMIM